MSYYLTLLTLFMTSKLVTSGPVRVKKEAPKVSIEISQQELRNYIKLQIRNYKAEQLNCRLDQYWQEGTCRPCEEICGVVMTQLCQRECPGYPLLNYKLNDYKINNEQDNQIFINRMMIYGALVMLVIIIAMQAVSLCRSSNVQKSREDVAVCDSRSTGLSTLGSQRRENPVTNTERRPFIQPHQGGNNIGSRLAGGNNQQIQNGNPAFNQIPPTHDNDTNSVRSSYLC